MIAARTFRAAVCVAALASCASRGTIGAVLAQNEQGRVLVRETPVGLAAWRAGIEPGDELLLIDGADVRAMTPAELHRRLGGEVGDNVRLTFVRGEEVKRVTLRLTPARKHRVP